VKESRRKEISYEGFRERENVKRESMFEEEEKEGKQSAQRGRKPLTCGGAVTMGIEHRFFSFFLVMVTKGMACPMGRP